MQPFRAEGGRKGWRMLDAGSSPSASPYATNILRSLPSAHESTITTGFARKPPHRDAPAETRNSFSPPVCLQTSGLRGFSTELVNADLKRIFRPTTFASRAVSSMREPPRRGDCLLARSRVVRSASATALAAGTRCSSWKHPWNCHRSTAISARHSRPGAETLGRPTDRIQPRRLQASQNVSSVATDSYIALSDFRRVVATNCLA